MLTIVSKKKLLNVYGLFHLTACTRYQPNKYLHLFHKLRDVIQSSILEQFLLLTIHTLAPFRNTTPSVKKLIHEGRSMPSSPLHFGGDPLDRQTKPLIRRRHVWQHLSVIGRLLLWRNSLASGFVMVQHPCFFRTVLFGCFNRYVSGKKDGMCIVLCVTYLPPCVNCCVTLGAYRKRAEG